MVLELGHLFPKLDQELNLFESKYLSEKDHNPGSRKLVAHERTRFGNLHSDAEHQDISFSVLLEAAGRKSIDSAAPGFWTLASFLDRPPSKSVNLEGHPKRYLLAKIDQDQVFTSQ
ncbi:hypothetical protein PGT21_014921 [Puccinia graminis f. sp. tritici]|uniref:Uncharacterized protein n=1 Tax=Puccinia graminis f. sp. tritici TaxID=56615 RepID=A0A5B0LNJ8_PUCGR|nr:hypothetical protein PGTUg99_017774 [Puccinia graminis f. sp. tritici]KAA1090827.1 hypothetical protein PGT21_014921 [Puccinia graminis f. sp. tritici]